MANVLECDRCQATTPIADANQKGWRQIALHKIGEPAFIREDLCRSCFDAVVTMMQPVALKGPPHRE